MDTSAQSQSAPAPAAPAQAQAAPAQATPAQNVNKPTKKPWHQQLGDSVSSSYNQLKSYVSSGGKRKNTRRKKGGNPKKGMKSKTRKGRKDFVTHKGDKYYNRNNKRQTRNRSGKKGKPYSRRR